MKIKLLLILSILLTISACVQLGGGKGSANDAVLFEFMPNMPPQDQIYEGQNFRIGLNIMNFEEKQKSIYVCIYDSLGDFVSGVPSDICYNINLKPAYRSGDDLISWDEKIYFPDKDSFYRYLDIEGKMSTNIYADVSYTHQTIARSQMCIKRDANIEPQGINCELVSQEEITNNDAPVKVTRIEKNIIPAGRDKINLLLKIDISNVGSGKVIDKNDIYLNEERLPVIDLNVVLSRKQPVIFECQGLYNGKLLFKENQKTIICEGLIDMKDDFSEEMVKVTLDYGYKLEKISSTIQLVDKDIYV